MAIENLGSDRCNYKYKTAPQTHLNNRELIYHRGKGLGGTSGINYMAWIKGYRGDFQAWADLVGDQAYSADEGWRRIQKVSRLNIWRKNYSDDT
jgi:choline dehydrogenase-like flavoprotein